MPPNTGRANGNPDDDDYVAQVLANEARDSSLKYSALGMGAYMPKRPTGAAPKPNTRFLRHIIKETDNHNLALKRKEEREARERMRQLRNQPASSSNDSRKDAHGGQPRSDDRKSRRDRREDREDKQSSYRRRHRSRSASADRDRSHRRRRRRDSYGEDEDRHRSSRRIHRHRSYSRSRSRSPQENRETKSHSRHHRQRRRSRSPSRSRSRSLGANVRRRNRDREHTRVRSSHEKGSPERSSTSKIKASSPLPPVATQDQLLGYESDPLEDIVGPLPPQANSSTNAAPIRSRGRGAYRLNMSNIDTHFAPDYDPTLDVQLEDDDENAGSKPSRRPVAGLMTGDDDWELALEAVRDRARWKQTGEERLREAGFDDAFVKQWKSNITPTTGDSEGRLEDVKWSKKGEGREWDRGKYVNEDGHIDVKASW
ncbi:hypothetical protein BDV27DRAFT_61406 [Aspergillus caelatus]|uniref:Pre-mRNA-splicing factor 38B n=1 Tax=Aspergillus caelatus TaxID=61420 RepID=A0A5N7AN63_9EURO|nr:uncharacterized protein BDV27DRAFT_61406 [Aspergillus caelatus]KAE8370429.1 hypothetical protein BDV27DRAFT_61406 [Aspergillus caelatus]